MTTDNALGTISSRPGEAIDADALLMFLRSAIPGIATEGECTVDIRQFPSGFSNLTYLVRVRAQGDVERALVLRRPPRGVKPGIAHDVCREHDLLAVLHPRGVPVPKPVAKCEDVSVIGAPFYLMDFVDGVVLRGASMPVRAQVPDAGERDAPVSLAALSQLCVNALVQVHATDVTRGPLSALGRPMGYVERQVQGWTKRWHAAATNDVSSLAPVARWLDAHRPPDRLVSLVHNDFKFDNLVLDHALARVLAILDWELATIGDPLMVLGTSLEYWVEAGDDPVFRSLGLGVTALPGSFSRAQVVHAYGVASGRDVSDAVFYYVFGLFKVAVIAQQIYARHLQGNTRDPRFGGLGVVVNALGVSASRAIATQAL